MGSAALPRTFGRHNGTFGATPPAGVATVWIQLASSHGGCPWGDLAVRGGALFNQGNRRRCPGRQVLDKDLQARVDADGSRYSSKTVVG